MDTALPQKFPFNLDRNLAKANCTGNRVCTSCDTVVLDWYVHKTTLLDFISNCYEFLFFLLVLLISGATENSAAMYYINGN